MDISLKTRFGLNRAEVPGVYFSAIFGLYGSDNGVWPSWSNFNF